MEDANVWEMAILFGVVLVGTLLPLFIWRRRVRLRWRRAAAGAGLPFTGDNCIQISVPGGKVVAGEAFRTVSASAGSDLADQVVTSVLGILDTEPPAAFVASTNGAPLGGPIFTTGDTEFDATVVVGSKDLAEGQAYLTPRRRKALLTFFSTLPQGCLSAGRIGRVRDGRMYTGELTQTLLAVKQALEGLERSS